jgi:hypothetical protein
LGHIKINRTIREGERANPNIQKNHFVKPSISLAHRDYTMDNFAVTVEPNRYIEIKNPGSFKEKLKL